LLHNIKIMAKSKKKNGQIGMVIFLDEEFNLKLRKHCLYLEELGVHKTKAERIVELAHIGLLSESSDQK